jgi:hypothetical protein
MLATSMSLDVVLIMDGLDTGPPHWSALRKTLDTREKLVAVLEGLVGVEGHP